MSVTGRPSKTVYRVSGFPHDFTLDKLSQSIQQTYHVQPAGFTIHSLSLDLIYGSLPRQKVATISFRQTPAALGDLEKEEWSFEDASGLDRTYIDTHFRGFTPLTPEGNDGTCETECIFIHGWGANALGCLIADDPSYVWLRDDIPVRFPKLRIWTYGYGSRLDDSAHVSDHIEYGLRLKDALRAFRNSPQRRPMLFLVHSLGGLVFKQTISLMSKSDHPADQQNLRLIRGALLFGVPGQGMDTEALSSMVEGLPSQRIVNLLDQNIGFRQREALDDDFYSVVVKHQLEVYSFFEMRKSRTVVRKPDGTGWSRSGELSLLVKPTSATYSQRSQRRSNRNLSLDKDHSGLVKFSRNDREDYLQVCLTLSDLIETTKTDAQSQPDYQGGNLEVNTQVLDLQQTFIDGLYAHVLQSRTRQISEAATGTYEWIFSSSKSASTIGQQTSSQERTRLLTDPSVSFIRWLRRGQGIYWITGEPGSGKSTMIKFIAQNSVTKTVLREWANSEDVTIASFYFWISGAPLQRSAIGLLQSIFHQILDRNRHLIATLFPYEWRRTMRSEHVDWTEESFENAITLLAELEDAGSRFCLFIDGLDEYEGDQNYGRDWLCNLLLKLGDLDHIKLCISSRYWPVFQSAFLSCPTLKLHEWTRSDIEQFVHQELEIHPLWIELMKLEAEETTRLVKEISHIAQGVFLWVVLTVEAIVKNLVKRVTIEYLFEILYGLPKSLNGFFDRILKDLDNEDRDYVIKALLITRDLGNFGGMPVLILSYLDMSDRGMTGRVPVRRQSLRKLEDAAVRAEGRLTSLCSGLLSIGKNRLSEEYGDLAIAFSRTTDLSHRTLADYLANPAMSQQLMLSNGSNFDAYAWFDETFLMICRRLPILWRNEPGLFNVIENLWYTWISQFKTRINLPYEQYLVELNSALVMLFKEAALGSEEAFETEISISDLMRSARPSFKLLHSRYLRDEIDSELSFANWLRGKSLENIVTAASSRGEDDV